MLRLLAKFLGAGPGNSRLGPPEGVIKLDPFFFLCLDFGPKNSKQKRIDTAELIANMGTEKEMQLNRGFEAFLEDNHLDHINQSASLCN